MSLAGKRTKNNNNNKNYEHHILQTSFQSAVQIYNYQDSVLQMSIILSEVKNRSGELSYKV